MWFGSGVREEALPSIRWFLSRSLNRWVVERRIRFSNPSMNENETAQDGTGKYDKERVKYQQKHRSMLLKTQMRTTFEDKVSGSMQISAVNKTCALGKDAKMLDSENNAMTNVFSLKYCQTEFFFLSPIGWA